MNAARLHAPNRRRAERTLRVQTDAPSSNPWSPTSPRRVLAVVLNYRTPQLVVECLQTLVPQLSPTRDLAVVVDNGSGDGSRERLEAEIAKRGWSRSVRLVASETNGGFAAGMNLGMRSFQAEAYLLLNSDTLLRAGALERMFSALQAEPDIGLVSPALEHPDGERQVNCFRYHTPWSELLDAARTGPLTALLRRWEVPMHDATPREPDWTSFAAVILRRQVFQQVGPLDEGYFLYFEDVDYCRCVREAGWRIVHEPAARVVHLHSRSSQLGARDAARRRRPEYIYTSRRRYLLRAFGWKGLIAANLMRTVGSGVSWVREVFGHKQPHAPRRQLVDTWLRGGDSRKP